MQGYFGGYEYGALGYGAAGLTIVPPSKHGRIVVYRTSGSTTISKGAASSARSGNVHISKADT